MKAVEFKKLMAALEEKPVEGWVVNKFVARYKKEIEIWIANGRSFCRLEYPPLEFPWWQRWRLWRFVQRLSVKIVESKVCR